MLSFSKVVRTFLTLPGFFVVFSDLAETETLGAALASGLVVRTGFFAVFLRVELAFVDEVVFCFGLVVDLDLLLAVVFRLVVVVVAMKITIAHQCNSCR